MELSDEERYAVASLFTLALHATQYDGGNVTDEAWGEPATVERDPRLISYLTEAELEGWWGYDLVAPSGLLDRIYRELQLPPSRWRPLKQLPTAAPSAGEETFKQMVRGLIAMLDAELAAALPPLLPRRDSTRSRPGSGGFVVVGGAAAGGGAAAAGPLGSPHSPAEAQRRAVRDDLFAGLIHSDSEDDDEDWAADLEREKKLQASAERKHSGSNRRPSAEADSVLRRLSGSLTLGSQASKEAAAAAAADGGAEAAAERRAAAADAAGVGEEVAREPSRLDPLQHDDEWEEQRVAALAAAAAADVAAAAQLAKRAASIPQVEATPKAMGAVWELVQCCVGAVPLRRDPSQPPLPRPPAVQWYDARARQALLLVASWLQVTPRKVANLELLLTQDKAPRHKAVDDFEEDSWSRRMRYLKVGAAAVGGGALFAVTGGLAAPAIAAGMGSILGFIGAPTAIAGTISGFLASTAGAATVTTTMAASGTATFGSRMAYRVAEISEFGFRELLPQAAPALPSPLPSPALPQPSPQQTAAPPPARQHSPQRGPAERQHSGHLMAGSSGADSADRGHLGQLGHSAPGGSGYQSARAQALSSRLSSTSSFGSMQSAPSRSSSSGALQQQGAQPSAPLQQQAQQAQQQQAQQQQAPSAWQRWFGSSSSSGGSSKKEKEDLLLPVPMRTKQSGDIRAVTIYVAGWVSSKEDYENAWQGCVHSGDSDAFTLVWESKVLLHLSGQLGTLLSMQAAGQGLQLATHSFFYAGAGLVAALGPTVLLGSAAGLIISNAWAVASDRAVKAGKLLAHLLLTGAHGDRPVMLVAHGMGARLVFHCLLELCRQGARGVVQHAVLMGCPVGTEDLRWRMARRAVAGRLINAYSRKDWLLGVCAGGSSGWMKATAGLVPIEGVPGVENVNLSSLVEGHFGYLENMDGIIDMLSL